ncbi:hypothetical protein PHLCEN_2v2898 [Hermanssonia centrifuga]|uniref:alpha-1,2-Mannosidase n=1 Tax=Hermanssonia centrifuga TaxID=98765 RepID=A0A2R6RI99_9APHY|nr:hypothetical protein PHLCEN_2v2898 [Hermanssonia centrifuga]
MHGVFDGVVDEPWRLPSPVSQDDLSNWKERANRVKDAFVTAYLAYEQNAYPHDELLPGTNGHADRLNGWGATTVDGIDTMVLMGLHEMSNKTVQHVAQLTFDRDQSVQFFETVIRYLGGFLSAYALTKNPVFLARADDLGRKLLPAFNTPSGLPTFGVNPLTGQTRSGWMGNVAILSEMGSCQMEYRYLAHLTGRPEYVRVVDHVTEHMRQHEERGGLFPTTYDLNSGDAKGNSYSVGSLADSAYEYLIKLWLMTDRTESKYLDMYLKSTEAIMNDLLYLSPARQLLFVTDAYRNNMAPTKDFQHLSCFIAGVFALGAVTIPNVDPRHAWVAEGLAHTCWITYADSQTGLGPERVMFRNGGTKWVDEVTAWERAGKVGGVPPGVNQTAPIHEGEDMEYTPSDHRYLLRPETIESFYILWRTTGDSKWRDRGWAMFDAIETHTKTANAYASISNVYNIPTKKENDMPSWFFAETLKYAYLLFTDEDLIPLNQWVFNTEAHPFPIFRWSEWETKHLDIH